MNRIIHTIITLVLLNSCMTEVSETALQEFKEDLNASDFDYTTISNEEIRLTLRTADGKAVRGAVVSFYSLADGRPNDLILKAVTDENGQFSISYNMPSHIDTVLMNLNYIGLPNHLLLSRAQFTSTISVSGTNHEYVEYSFSTQVENSMSMTGRIAGEQEFSAFIHSISTYNSDGVPHDLLDPDIISTSLLEFINASLPEGKPVPTYHPEYLAEDAETNLIVTEKADVWITFVHEGAGYKNTLGYFTYPTGNRPTTTSDIDTVHVIFPNASYRNAGGDLIPGDKMYLGQFDKGTSIGFVLLANGWKGEITEGLHQVYSINDLNQEESPENRQHSVLLYDDENELFLLGFEDLNRDGNSDDDFNDAVFYATANPIEAISSANVKPIDKPVDDDGDGVNNTYDEFPNNPDLAYSYFYPGEKTYGSLAFEDQWPGYGDYDFNDLVVDYQFQKVADTKNRLVQLNTTTILKAAGAGFSNALGIQLDIDPSAVASIVGNEIYGNFFDLASNGTESGQSNAVIIITDNVHRSLGSNGFVNTDPNLAFITPDTVRTETKFTVPLSLSEVGTAPFNPFLVINQTRGREVHLPGYAPTDKVDEQYFGSGNDDSDPRSGRYYKSKVGLPWAMNLPVPFDYPSEKKNIRNAYVHFNTWVHSDGYSYMDWYVDQEGFRFYNYLYSR